VSFGPDGTVAEKEFLKVQVQDNSWLAQWLRW
jgi:hypothetical protein